MSSRKTGRRRWPHIQPPMAAPKDLVAWLLDSSDTPRPLSGSRSTEKRLCPRPRHGLDDRNRSGRHWSGINERRDEWAGSVSVDLLQQEARIAQRPKSCGRGLPSGARRVPTAEQRNRCHGRRSAVESANVENTRGDRSAHFGQTDPKDEGLDRPACWKTLPGATRRERTQQN